MKSILNFLISWYKFSHKNYNEKILSIRVDLKYVLRLNAYIKALSLFPYITPRENRVIVNIVLSDILDISDDKKNKEEKNEFAEQLRESLFSDEKIMDTFADYFLTEYFYLSVKNKDRQNKDLNKMADDALIKAKSYKNTAEPISAADVDIIKKEIKKKIKKLNKSIEKEESKTRKPIKIQSSIIFIFISVFSGVFLVGGFLHTIILLEFFDINSSDFFDISDYISSNVDIVFPILSGIFFGLFGYFIFQRDVFLKIITADQLDNKASFGEFWNSVLVISGVLAVGYGISFYVELVHYDRFIPVLLSPLAFVILISIFLIFLKMDKYIENRFIFRTAVILIFSFLVYIGIDISDTLYKVKNDTYKNPYNISFTAEYEEYSDHAFFLANSKYVFLLNKETKELAVIPKTGIKAIRTKNPSWLK